MNSMKTNLLVSALTIALCLVLVAGATFALYTSEAPSSAVVTPAKVDVVATFGTPDKYNNASTTNKWLVDEEIKEVSPGQYRLENMAPFEGFTIDVVIQNKSDIAVQWRMEFEVKCDDEDFRKYFQVKIGEEILNPASKWSSLGIGAQTDPFSVTVELSGSAPVYEEPRTCTIMVKVIAVQANANPDADYITRAQW